MGKCCVVESVEARICGGRAGGGCRKTNEGNFGRSPVVTIQRSIVGPEPLGAESEAGLSVLALAAATWRDAFFHFAM